MDKDLYDFLKERGVDVEMLNRENIDRYCLEEMEEDTMCVYIPKIGDRISLRSFLSREVDDSLPIMKRKSRSLERIRRKLKLPPKDEREKMIEKPNRFQPGNSFGHKTTRVIEVGWIQKADASDSGQRVKPAKGGGFRRITVNKTDKKETILKLAKRFFFDNQGISKLGTLEDFVFNLLDFQENEVDDDITVEALYRSTGLPQLRFFMTTQAVETDENFLLSALQDSGIDLMTPCPMAVTARASTRSDVVNKCPDTLPDLPGEYVTSNPQVISDSTDSMTSEHEHTFQEHNVMVIWDQQQSDGTDSIITSTPNHPLSPTLPPQNVEGNICADVSGKNFECADTPTVLFREPENLDELLRRIQTAIQTDDKKNIVNVTRHNILDGGLRAFLRSNFNPFATLSVKFSGEPAMDDGGVSREFLTLALDALANSRLFHGSDKKYLNLDASALERREYLAAGKILAFALVHHGLAARFFSHLLLEMIVGTNADIDIPMEAIPEEQRTTLHQIEDTKCKEAFDDIIMEKIDTGIFQLAGCSTCIQYDRKAELLNNLKRFIADIRIKAALQQFMEGLETLDVLQWIRKYPTIMKTAFVHEENPLTAEKVADLFPVKQWSPEGSNKRRLEATMHSFFMDFLLDLQEDGTERLEEFLMFITGNKQIPVGGFEPPPQLLFRHDCTIPIVKEYPLVSTCALTLSLPILHCYETFKTRMLDAMGVKYFSME